MGTAFLTELRLLSRNPQLVVSLVLLPVLFVGLLSEAAAPIWPTSNPYQSTIPAYTIMFCVLRGSVRLRGLFP